MVKYSFISFKDLVWISTIIIILAACNKKSPDFYYKNGNAKYQLKDYNGAIKDLNLAIEKEPAFMQAYHTRAICYGELSKYDEAMSDFGKTIELNPKFKNAYLNRAYYVKVKTGDYAGAIEDYNKFIELNEDGNNAFALNNRGFAKFNLNDTVGAFNDIQSSINSDSTNSFAFKNRALIYISMDSINRACKDLKKALELGYTKNYDNEAEDLLRQYCGSN